MEYLDVLDENGDSTGESKSRDEVHKKGIWHRTVHVWILNSRNELLLQKRASRVISWPDMWDISVAGHIVSGDNSFYTVLKETEEEIGLKLGKNDFQFLFTVKNSITINNGTYINNEFNDVYLIKKDLNISDLFFQKEEVSKMEWIRFKELERRIKSGDKTIVPQPEEYEKLFSYLKK